ncbi:MAG: glycine--tRNA ligase subunit beta, partial [Gammaproteobacteria bacterium]|nr:glycine--tRNA ligase subunit beta [Gammaproteobacteria bacterium]
TKIERRDFLFELGTEELPPKALGQLEAALREGIAGGLASAGLAHGAIESFAAPRRLAVRVRRLAAQQPDQAIRRRGPPLRAAFDASGAPTRAAQAFAASCGVALEALGRERDEKQNEYLWYGGTRPGTATVALLPGLVSAALEALPIPKRMRWGALEAQFVRPVHWLVMLFGTEIVPATILAAVAGRATRGHRFHAPRELPLRAPASYERTLLTRGKVVAGFAARRERIRAQVAATAAQAGGQAIISEALLDEVTALVEWPVTLAGRFDERFLALPREVLVATLQDHQRYFALEDARGTLLPWFITVSNIESREPDVVRNGNERVVRPRLADAAFFWEQDRRTPLAARCEALDRVTFQAQLGSIGDKVRRITALALELAPACGAQPARVARAAQLAKCDLLSAMVGEFPELQGVMGAYYARSDGEDAEVASAIREHYLPRGAGDSLPATPSGIAL